MRKIILALVAAFSFLAPVAAYGQACPAVAALPDSERRVAYSPSSSTGPFSVTFAVLGDGTDYSAWLEVWLNGVRLTPVTDWQLTIPSGTLATACRPITNASITLTTAATGTLQIVGARRPRRTSQFAENRGVAARDLNQAITDIIAQNRETWDKINDVTGRGLFSQPGNVMGGLPLPAACANGFLGFDSTGLTPVCRAGGAGSGNVVGPLSSTVGHFAVWDNTTGTLLADSGVLPTSASANPTASVGLTAINGSANTAMRSDAAPALSAAVQSALTGTNHAVLIGTGVFGLGTAGPCASGGFLVYNTGAGADPTCSTVATTNAVLTGSLTAPQIIGGTAAGSSLALQSTSGVGTSDFIRFLVGNNGATEAARFETSGKLLIGLTSPITVNSTTAPGIVQIAHATPGSVGLINSQWTNNGNGAFVAYAHSRGTSVGTHTILQDGDQIGGLYFNGSDGTKFVAAANIVVHVDGTPGTNDMPGRITFWTSPDGTVNPAERLRIANTGFVSIGNAVSPVALLHLSLDSTVPNSALYAGTEAAIATSNGATDIRLVGASATAATAPIYRMLRARGTVASPTIVSSGDTIGTYQFSGFDGTGRIVAATISAIVDATPGTNDMPGALVLSTTPDGTAAVVQRVKIDNAGLVTVGLAGGANGAICLAGSTSGCVTTQVQAAAGTYNWNLPITAGSSGDLLTSGGGGATAMTWTTTLAVGHGGIGVGTLASNGVLYGNGTSPVQALAVNATATNKFLTQSSSNAPAWATIAAADLPGSFSGFANPTATICMSAVNGSATTAKRSDGASALSTSCDAQLGSLGLGVAGPTNGRISQTLGANNVTGHLIKRNTDTSPTGKFLDFQNAAAASVYTVDITGAVTVGSWTATKIGLLYGGTNADLSATGGTSQVLRQVTLGGNITVARLACADLSDAGSGCSGSSNIVVGTTVVTSGTTTRVLYDNAGVVGEYAITGTGSVVMSSAPTLVNPVVGTQSALDNSTKAASTAYVDAATRERLSADRTYYVRTDGSDSNNGLANTAGGAFLTIQHALNVCLGIDLNSHAVTIQIGNGTYNEALSVTAAFLGGTVQITGDTTTPSNVVINGGSSSVLTLLNTGTALSIKGIKITNNTASGLTIRYGSSLTINGNMEFGATGGNHITIQYDAQLSITADYSISAAATVRHIFCGGNAVISQTDNGARTVTLSGTQAYNTFATADSGGVIDASNTTYTGGTITGTRYSVSSNGVIRAGGDANKFPGNVAGSTATGGQYIWLLKRDLDPAANDNTPAFLENVA